MKTAMKKMLRGLKNMVLTEKQRRHLLVGPATLWKMKRDFQIDFMKRMGLRPENTLLDIGCGTLRGGVAFIDYLDAGNYCGIDVRENALAEGRKELAEHGLEGKQPELLLVPDMSKLVLDRKFDFIWSFSVLFHMTDEILDDALAAVSRALKDDGVFYANVHLGHERDAWLEFPVVWRTMDAYREKCARVGLEVTEVGLLRDLGHLSKIESQDDQMMLKFEKKKAA